MIHRGDDAVDVYPEPYRAYEGEDVFKSGADSGMEYAVKLEVTS